MLRKKTQQVTFLHVYHHAGMVLGVHLYITFFPGTCSFFNSNIIQILIQSIFLPVFFSGSHSTMLGVINLLVHTVMYGYYFIASVRPSTSSLWWKRYITQMQLAQFAYLAFHFLQVVVNNSCNHPFLIAIVGFMQNIFMFSLFFEFYYRTYMKKDKKVNSAAVGVANEKQVKSS